jgi:hypothetical protein
MIDFDRCAVYRLVRSLEALWDWQFRQTSPGERLLQHPAIDLLSFSRPSFSLLYRANRMRNPKVPVLVACGVVVATAVLTLSRAPMLRQLGGLHRSAKTTDTTIRASGDVSSYSTGGGRHRRPTIPTLADLMDPNEPDRVGKSKVEFLLDFAIVGYPKTGTSFLLDWLAQQPQVLAYTREMHELQEGRVADFVAAMYNLSLVPPATTTAPSKEPPASMSTSSTQTESIRATVLNSSVYDDDGYGYKRGYKAPRDVANRQAMRILDEYWPNAHLIVGLRHPVLWFESYYNFRVRKGNDMAPATSPAFLLDEDECLVSKGTHGVCADGSRFHVHLSRLGKTPMSSKEELALLGRTKAATVAASRATGRTWRQSRRKLFLYEISQLHEGSSDGSAAAVPKPVADDPSNSTQVDRSAERRAERFRRDLSRYVGLGSVLSDAYSEPNQYLPNRTKAIRICDPQYQELRHRLMSHARDASIWIRTYLLGNASNQDEGVVVSSPNHFRSLLRSWMDDPCDSASD